MYSKIVCKYCLRDYSKDSQRYWYKSSEGEYNCDSCEVMCHIAVDMIKRGVHTIVEEIDQSIQPERSKREDSQKCEMRCSEHCGNTMRDK